MSFDPYGHTPQPPRPPADPTAPIDYPMTDAGPRPPGEAGRDRVQLPGIFLILIGVLNVLPGMFFGYTAVTNWMQDADALHANALDQARKARDQMRNLPEEHIFRRFLQQTVEALEKTPPADLKSRAVWQNGGTAAVIALISLIQVLGGVRMLQMRSYILCVIAALISAIPCVSLSGCCCIGQAVGIWALVTLFNNDVRSAFR